MPARRHCRLHRVAGKREPLGVSRTRRRCIISPAHPGWIGFNAGICASARSTRLAAIEWPDDELSVFATLKGSLFAIRDEVLLRYRHERGRLYSFHKFDAAADPDFVPVEEALALLGELHRARNRRPFAATVNALLEATRAHAGFVLRPGGNQILANVARLADLARTYEMSGGISFRGFVDELATQAEKEEAAEAPVLEEDSDGVRLMTAHGAKGLEFP